MCKGTTATPLGQTTSINHGLTYTYTISLWAMQPILTANIHSIADHLLFKRQHKYCWIATKVLHNHHNERYWQFDRSANRDALVLPPLRLQCFDRKGIRPVKKLSCGVLVWLSVWSEMQTCIWPTWCHCHSLSLASVKSWLVLPFWYRLTRVVPD